MSDTGFRTTVSADGDYEKYIDMVALLKIVRYTVARCVTVGPEMKIET